ncbi:LytR/AlgR family response regulator transcription factor [Psychroflexus lacisalsi]|jgi:DNA-binding LytR/AlgR family response regulator|uniref:LytTR family DNA-binding domain-containing protein n=1 Tax=Psychroflexus lacisalsi TaxID=503928 RepID=A0ABN1K7V3_9FLAO|nr:LytTR family DNA-binding domain-containing protein [Psychroflexus lacisalsi]MBZ9619536.1 LytTR family DNA-binding domain-containing protein [Psychroflexus lacisalsi]
MSKIIIVEDEKPAARRLERLLSALQYEVLKKLHSVEEAIDWFQKQPKADLIFLDIQLSDGLSFEIFEKVNIEADLIFTTAYDEYALKAFKLNSIDYLLKPIDPIELKSALKKYEKRKSSQSIDAELLKSLLIQPKNEPTYKTRFSVKVGEKLKTYSADEISCFESSDKATSLVTLEGKHYVVDESLNQLEPKLSPKDFFRINRSHIIHYKAIDDMVSYSTSRIKINVKALDQPVIVSRERVKDFKTWIG